MFNPIFNHRPRHERLGLKRDQTVKVPLDQLPVSSTLDPDFDGLGHYAEPDVYLAPGLVAHYDASYVNPIIERSERRTA